MNIPSFVMWDGRKLNKDIFIRASEENAMLFVQYNTTMQEVHRQDYTRTREMLDSVTEIGVLARQKLLLCFHGYDDDTRALHQVPEVTRYINNVVEQFPHLWYFVLPELNQHLFVSMVAHVMFKSPLIPPLRSAPYTPPNQRSLIQLDTVAADKLFATMTTAVTEYGRSVGDERGARSVLRDWRHTLNL